MYTFVAVWENLGSRKLSYDDDVVDRLSHRYTTAILVCFALVINTYQYVGNPINCWVPQHFTGSHTKYANSFCWVRNTYYLPFGEYIPDEATYDDDHKEEHELPYYQWLPFILLGQAVFFYIPTLVWHSFNSKAGVDADDILHATYNFDEAEKVEDRFKQLQLIINQLDRFVGNPKRRQAKAKRRVTVGSKFGNYLVLLYFFVKILFIFNILAQLFVMNRVLGTEFDSLGIDMLVKIQEETFGTVYSNSSVFPTVTMCNFKVRRLGNVHRYAVQCVLPINLYAEKMYIFLWFWMVFVLGLTGVSLVMWLLQMCLFTDKLRYIRNHLQKGNRLETRFDKQLSRDFVEHYLKNDGVFVLRLISHNTNHITSTEVICALWDLWKDGNPLAKDTPPPPLSNDATPEPDDIEEIDEKPSRGKTPETLPLYPSAPEPVIDPENDIPPLTSTGSKPSKPAPPPKPAHLSKR